MTIVNASCQQMLYNVLLLCTFTDAFVCTALQVDTTAPPSAGSSPAADAGAVHQQTSPPSSTAILMPERAEVKASQLMAFSSNSTNAFVVTTTGLPDQAKPPASQQQQEAAVHLTSPVLQTARRLVLRENQPALQPMPLADSFSLPTVPAPECPHLQTVSDAPSAWSALQEELGSSYAALGGVLRLVNQNILPSNSPSLAAKHRLPAVMPDILQPDVVEEASAAMQESTARQQQQQNSSGLTVAPVAAPASQDAGAPADAKVVAARLVVHEPDLAVGDTPSQFGTGHNSSDFGSLTPAAQHLSPGAAALGCFQETVSGPSRSSAWSTSYEEQRKDQKADTAAMAEQAPEEEVVEVVLQVCMADS